MEINKELDMRKNIISEATEEKIKEFPEKKDSWLHQEKERNELIEHLRSMLSLDDEKKIDMVRCMVRDRKAKVDEKFDKLTEPDK